MLMSAFCEAGATPAATPPGSPSSRSLSPSAAGGNASPMLPNPLDDGQRRLSSTAVVVRAEHAAEREPARTSAVRKKTKELCDMIAVCKGAMDSSMLKSIDSMLCDGIDPSEICSSENAASALHAAVLRALTGSGYGAGKGKHFDGRTSDVALAYEAAAWFEPAKPGASVLRVKPEHRLMEDTNIGPLLRVLRAPTLRNIDVQQRPNGLTALGIACIYGSVECARRLLDARAGVDVRFQKGDWTPLQTAAEHGHAAVCRLLLERNAQVNAIDLDGLTALHWAAEYGSAECARALLEGGADSSLRTVNADTALMLAERTDNRAVVRVLGGVVEEEIEAKPLPLPLPLPRARPPAAKPNAKRARLAAQVGADSEHEASSGSDESVEFEPAERESGSDSELADELAEPGSVDSGEPEEALAARYRGVAWVASEARWLAHLPAAGSEPAHSLGLFASAREAAAAVDHYVASMPQPAGDVQWEPNLPGGAPSPPRPVSKRQPGGARRGARAAATPAAVLERRANLRKSWHFAATDGEQEDEDISCSVCAEGNSVERNKIVCCDGCEVAVHQGCYLLPDLPADGSPWLCAPCRAAASATGGSERDAGAVKGIRSAAHGLRECRLCPVPGGALWRVRPEAGGGYVHAVCATHAGYYGVPHRDGARELVGEAPPKLLLESSRARRRSAELLPCAVCGEVCGGKVRCEFASTARSANGLKLTRIHCKQVLHASCAHLHDLVFIDGRDNQLFACAQHVASFRSPSADFEVSDLLAAAEAGQRGRVVELLLLSASPAEPVSGAAGARHPTALNACAAQNEVELLEMMVNRMQHIADELGSAGSAAPAGEVSEVRQHVDSMRAGGLPSALHAACRAGCAETLLLLLTRCTPPPSAELFAELDAVCSAALSAGEAAASPLRRCQRVLHVWATSGLAGGAGGGLGPHPSYPPYDLTDVADISGGAERFPIPLLRMPLKSAGVCGAGGGESSARAGLEEVDPLAELRKARMAYITRPMTTSAAALKSAGMPTKVACSHLASPSFVPGVPLGARLILAPTVSCGLGVYAAEDIKEGTVICVYAGLIITRVDAACMQEENHYLMDCSSQWTIDGRHFRNIGGFINFSCQPKTCNLAMEKEQNWQLTSKQSHKWPVFRAKQNIAKGEELSYLRDVNALTSGGVVCRCGKPGCRRLY